ncbi:hypothetical protein GCM10007989_05210 [Devosia pacifica]|uniref:Peptidase S24/S26A/S26B/S26C domain-containing protein n=1 Tax=Devosia pacifica TaxID=1335967 RepID=A0A918RUU8_9HYPH|nr:hypothetical protein [Devosia pacifica]GHA13573.1 hypothetical protein GCM10007989_05210 [Devosia pacifica]
MTQALQSIPMQGPTPALLALAVRGDLMSPRLRDGQDAVYYARSGFVADDIYVLDYGDGHLFVCHVQYTGHGTYRLFGEKDGWEVTGVARHQLQQIMVGIVVCEMHVRDREMLLRLLGRLP